MIRSGGAENNNKQIKLRWALFVTYTIIQSIMRSEMCSLHLTHPSGAVGSWHCGARGAVGGSVPCSRVSPQSCTSCQSRDSNPQPWVSSPTLYPLGHDCPDWRITASQSCQKNFNRADPLVFKVSCTVVFCFLNISIRCMLYSVWQTSRL